MAQLSLQHLDKIYDNKVQAVYDFNIDIEQGEFIVLVGPSGCGKSTTLRMIAGLEDISKGHLILDGKDITTLPPKDRDMAMVFQNYALYGHMTIYENMAFSLTLRKEDPNIIHKKVLAAAEILDLTSQLNKKPNQLSGGQRQRVAMGRAIVRNPKLFLFDEPLSNLDAKLRGSTRREIMLLHKKLGATMLYVTHDQTEALTLADRIVCMSMGHVQQIGTPLELYDNPANLFVASFIGLPPMNFFEVLVSGDKLIGPHFEAEMNPLLFTAISTEPQQRVRSCANSADGVIIRTVTSLWYPSRRCTSLIRRPQMRSQGRHRYEISEGRKGIFP